MKNFTFVFTLIILIILSTSCSKNDEEVPPTTPPIGLIKKVMRSDGLVTEEYSYYDDYSIRQSIKRSNTLTTTRTYQLKSDTIIVMIVRETSTEIQVDSSKSYYIGNDQYRQDAYQYWGGFIYGISTYEGNDCGPAYHKTYTSDNALLVTSYFEYLDENCSKNITRNDGSSDYTYGSSLRDNKNYYANSVAIGFIGNIPNKGNVYQDMRWDQAGQLVSSYSIVYDYNSNDYPISSIETDVDGALESYSYEYF